jgi:Ca2+-binding RTX toxin-like protein
MNNILDGMINSLAVQGTNVIAAGDVSGLVVVVRFNTGTNSFDSSFGSGGVSLLDSLTTRGGAKAVAVDTHNAIGIVTTDDSNDELLVLRLTANGALDTTFSGDGVANTGLISGENDIAGITSNANGNLVAVGSLKVTPLNQDVAVERFQSGYIVNPAVAINGAPASSPEGTAINLTSMVTVGSAPIANYAWSVTKNGNPYTTGSAASFSFTPDDNASYVVTLTVTATDGGTGTAPAQTITVTNVAPTPTIHGAPASSPEGTAINVSATSTDPGTFDNATYAWSVTKNGNPYASGSGVSFSFTPDDNASYVITLTATDNDLSAGTTTATVSVTNVAPTPTIHGAPALSPEGTAINVSATSTDPGTMDTATYAWSVTKNGSPYASGAGVNFSFTPDDNASYVITLTATDKDLSAGTTTATVSVTNVAPSATINGAPASSPAGTPINLTSTVTDPAGANDPISYAWSVTRNGVAYGTNGTGANYSFTPADAATYVVTLTVNDGDGGSDTKTATINVTPVATGVSATLSGGILTIAGDGAGNTVNVSLNGAGNYHVVIGTQVDQVFAFGAVHNILIQAGAGDDVITIASGVSIPAEVHGGDGNDIIQAGGGDDMLFGEDGNDILTGGSGNDVIIGGEGGDVLSGGNGRDILVGGLGPDIITGDNGDDILIAGATAYNTDPVGLSAIRSIWTGGGSYTTRVNALKSNLLATANLFNDTSIDLLSGNNGQDWIIANVASGGTLDQILGIAGNEVVTDL